MKTLVKIVLVAAVMVAPMGAMSDEEGDVKYRKAIMKGVAGHAGAIAQIANGKVSHMRESANACRCAGRTEQDDPGGVQEQEHGPQNHVERQSLVRLGRLRW